MLLGASLLGNLLTGKGKIRVGEGRIKAGQGFLMPLYPLTNFEIKKYCKNEPKFNGVYSRSNLPKIKIGADVLNLGKFKSIGAHWIALYVNGNNATYFDSFGVKYIPNEIKKLYRKQKIS